MTDRELLATIHALSAEATDDELGLGPSWQLRQIREALGGPRLDLGELREAWSGNSMRKLTDAVEKILSEGGAP